MEIRRVKRSKIEPAAYNPRKDLQPGDPEYEKLKRSMEEFDLVEPLVWNRRTGNLTGGHQRLKILDAKQGYPPSDYEVEVSVVDLPPAREKALNVALNKIEGDWDYPKLAQVFAEIDMGEFELELTGWETDDIKEIMHGGDEWEPSPYAAVTMFVPRERRLEALDSMEKLAVRLGGRVERR